MSFFMTCRKSHSIGVGRDRKEREEQDEEAARETWRGTWYSVVWG